MFWLCKNKLRNIISVYLQILNLNFARILGIWSAKMSFIMPLIKIREQSRKASSPYFSWAQFIILVIDSLMYPEICIELQSRMNCLSFQALNDYIFVKYWWFSKSVYKPRIFAELKHKYTWNACLMNKIVRADISDNSFLADFKNQPYIWF